MATTNFVKLISPLEFQKPCPRPRFVLCSAPHRRLPHRDGLDGFGLANRTDGDRPREPREEGCDVLDAERLLLLPLLLPLPLPFPFLPRETEEEERAVLKEEVLPEARDVREGLRPRVLLTDFRAGLREFDRDRDIVIVTICGKKTCLKSLCSASALCFAPLAC